MIVTREQVMEALFAQIQTATVNGQPAWQNATRKYVPITSTNQANRPYLIMLEDDETAQRARAGMPPMRLTMNVRVICYCWTAGVLAPATILNPLLDALQTALQPGPNPGIYQQSLGGVAYDAWIDGKILKVPGYIDGQGLFLVPIKVLVP